jgi:hypothetical protein
MRNHRENELRLENPMLSINQLGKLETMKYGLKRGVLMRGSAATKEMKTRRVRG